MGSLAGADRVDIRPLDHLNLHIGHFAEAQDRIFRPARACDALPVEADALLQHPARGLYGTTLDLVDDAVGIDRFADIDRQRQIPDGYFLGALDFGDRSAIGAGVLVAGKGHAMTNARLLLGLPFGASGNGTDDILGPLIAQVTQPESDRILTAFGGDFIEDGFNRKHIALPTKRPQRRSADRHGRQTMALDPPGWKIIQRDRIAIAATAIGLRR